MCAVLSMSVFPFGKEPGPLEVQNIIGCSCFVSQGVLSMRNSVLDRENSDMTLDAQERGVFSLDITATDQPLSSNERKSSTVGVRWWLVMSCFICLFVCLECCSRTLYFVLSLSRSRAKVLTTAGDLRKPKCNCLAKDRNRYLFIYLFIYIFAPFSQPLSHSTLACALSHFYRPQRKIYHIS